MVFKNLAEAIHEKLALIASVVTRIGQGGASADLRDLRQHLIAAVRLFQRNPGIEAAADDLYAAATALVADGVRAQQPNSRMLRIVKEAHLRLSMRLEAIVARVGPYEHLVVPAFPVRQAA